MTDSTAAAPPGPAAPIAPNEAALLRAAAALAREAGAGGATPEALAAAAGLRPEQAQSAAEALVARGLLARDEVVTARLAATDAGRDQAARGVPELRIRALVGDGATVQAAQDLPDLDRAAVGAAFGGLKKAGLLRVDGQAVQVAPGPGWAVHEARQALLVRLAGAPDGLDEATLELDPALRADVEARLPSKRGKRGGEPFERLEARVRRYGPTPAGAAALAGLVDDDRPEVAQLTPGLLKDGGWRGVRFRPFLAAAPAPAPFARRNPYRAFLDQVKQTLLGLGFEEMTGPLVETELWNTDALFLPQFHPARDIHDVYFVRDAERGPAGGPAHAFARGEDPVTRDAAEAVAREHEGRGASGSRGWAYDFDRQRTLRLVLRSQGTALSARWLRRARDPGKYFGMARCFRYDAVDATHAPDFFQVEGIVTSERTTFRHLLGLLELFARQVARSDAVKFVPAYFPFTEPSVEVHIRHPQLGWIELGGAGIFRPEVTRPHGVDRPVIAWGLGLDRMAMVALGVDDIRHLFTNNLPEGLATLRGG